MEVHARQPAQCDHRLRGIAADQMQFDIRQCLAHAWEYLLGQPVGGIDIRWVAVAANEQQAIALRERLSAAVDFMHVGQHFDAGTGYFALQQRLLERRSEEHTSELQSLMRLSYADFCLKKKNK